MRMWSDVEYVYRCLADGERTNAFRDAIEMAVKPGDVVLDLGSGSGIMAVLAARAGAAQVFAIEGGKYLGQASRQVFDDSGYGSKITSICIDARKVDASCVPKPDVVICEMITTGLIGEMQVPVMKALRASGLIDDRTHIVPAAISTSIALVQTDFQMFGLDFRFPRFVDYFSKSFEQDLTPLSPAECVHKVNFSGELIDIVNIDTTTHITNSGRVNGLLLSSTTSFHGGSTLGKTISYCQPVILPLRPEICASRDETMRVRVGYRMGWGFDSLKYAVRQVSRQKGPRRS